MKRNLFQVSNRYLKEISTLVKIFLNIYANEAILLEIRWFSLFQKYKI